jgi:hypothetical protein
MMQKGQEDEPKLVELLVNRLDPAEGFICLPCGTFTYWPDWRIGASPDRRLWWSRTSSWVLVECKSRQMLNEPRIPTLANWVQMQVQMACAGTHVCYYVCANAREPDAGDPVYAQVSFHTTAWNDYMYPALKEFCESVQKKIEPPVRMKLDTDRIAQFYEQSVVDLFTKAACRNPDPR